MQNTILMAICVIALGLSLQGCSTAYRYDVAGNLTCVRSEILNDSSFTVAPPIISNSGEEYGCPRRVTVNITAPSASTVHFTIDGSTPTTALPAYTGPFGVVLPKEDTTLQVQAIAVDECGAASKIVKQDYDCSGEGLTTPRISHWFDFPFPWLGKKSYDDVVYEGALLPAGCVVTGIKVKLLNPDNSFSYNSADTKYREATVDDHTGVSLKSYGPLNSRQLELKINSWHRFSYGVKYDVVYFVRGTNCVLPPFTYRTE